MSESEFIHGGFVESDWTPLKIDPALLKARAAAHETARQQSLEGTGRLVLCGSLLYWQGEAVAFSFSKHTGESKAMIDALGGSVVECP